jgi:hypothetical protein
LSFRVTGLGFRVSTSAPELEGEDRGAAGQQRCEDMGVGRVFRDV